MNVVVVGAGMAGLLLARALRDRGAAPMVIEALRDGVAVSHETSLTGLVPTGMGVWPASAWPRRRAGTSAGCPRISWWAPTAAARGSARSPGSRQRCARAGFAGLSFRSPVALSEPLAMGYQSDGRQVACVSWPGGTAGTFQIDQIGAERPVAERWPPVPDETVAPRREGARSRRAP